MSNEEFNDWMAYYLLDPFGNERADWHAAQVTAMIHNCNVKKTQQKNMEHFRLTFDPVKALEKRKQVTARTVDESNAQVVSFFQELQQPKG